MNQYGAHKVKKHMVEIYEVTREVRRKENDKICHLQYGYQCKAERLLIREREETVFFWTINGSHIALISLGVAARSLDILLFIDAEHSHLQPAVRYITLALMRKFNTKEKIVVANTLQCYLKVSKT